MEAAKERTQFFGSVDRDVKSNVTSEFPAWYFETHLDNMREERASLVRRMERGQVPQDNIPYAKQEAAAMQERIDEIMNSRPEIRDNERSELQRHHKELSKKITEAMFTRSEMMR